jgi:TP901 family phage tail tape measure protein
MGKEAAVLYIRVAADSKAARADLKNLYAVATNEAKTASNAIKAAAKQQATAEEDKAKRVQRALKATIKEIEGEERAIKRASASAEREYDRQAKSAQKSLLGITRAYEKAQRDQARIEREQNKNSAGSRFGAAVLSSRFQLPGTNGAIMPLIGQAARAGLPGLLGAGAVAVGAAAANTVKEGVGLAADLEQSLNVLQQQSGATTAELGKIREQARALGADLTLPATSSNDAATAMLSLSKAGLSLSDSMGAAKGALQLAAAAGIGAGEAAEIAAGELQTFGLEGGKAAEVADLLAGAANNSLGDIRDMAAAMRQVGAVAHSAGFSIQETHVAVSQLAKAGVQGSDAGTSLKTAILALTAPTTAAKNTMKALGISIYDSNGHMRPFREIIAQVTKGVSGLSDEQRNFALKTIFGTDAIRAANLVLAAGVEKYDQTRAIVTRAGQAGETAAAKMKGLKGALEGLNSTLETVKEKRLAPFNGTLTDLVNLGSETVTALDHMGDGFTDMGEKAQKSQGPIAALLEMVKRFNQEAEAARPKTPGQKFAKLSQEREMLLALKNGTTSGLSQMPGLTEYARTTGISGATTQEAANQIVSNRLQQVDAELAGLATQKAITDALPGAAEDDKRLKARVARETGSVALPPDKDKAARLAALMAGKQKKDHSGDKAAEAAKKRLVDSLKATTDERSGDVSAASYTLQSAMDALGEATTPEQIDAILANLQQFSPALTKAQTSLAGAQYDVSAAENPENLKAAAAAKTKAIAAANREQSDRGKEIAKAIQDARQRVLGLEIADGKRKEEEAQKSAAAYKEYLTTEQETLDQQVSQVSSLTEANQLIEQIVDSRKRLLQIELQEALLRGDSAGLLRATAGLKQLPYSRREMRDSVSDRYAVDVTGYPTYGADDVRTRTQRAGDGSELTQAADYSPQQEREAAIVANNITRAGEEAGRSFIEAIIGGDTRDALSGLIRDARRAVAGTVTDVITDRLITQPLHKVFDTAMDGFSNILKGLKASAGEILAGGYGLLAALGQQGKKKQAGSILGAALGLGIASLLPGVSLVQGLTYGAAAGAMFTPRAGGGPMLPGRAYYMEGNRPEIVTMGANGMGYTTGNAREVAGGAPVLQVVHNGDVYDGDYRHFKRDITDDLRDFLGRQGRG